MTSTNVRVKPDVSVISNLALTWAELDRHPRVIVDDNLRLLWVNSQADVLLDQRRDLQRLDGHFAPVNLGLRQQLETFIRGCTSMVGSWNLARADGDGHMVVRAQKLDDLPGRGCAYGISFYGTGSDFSASYADLDKVFALTPKEYRVLLDMINGLPADEVAQLREVSVETVRSHIRRIYEKVGVASREGLFFKLRPYRL